MNSDTKHRLPMVMETQKTFIYRWFLLHDAIYLFMYLFIAARQQICIQNGMTSLFSISTFHFIPLIKCSIAMTSCTPVAAQWSALGTLTTPIIHNTTAYGKLQWWNCCRCKRTFKWERSGQCGIFLKVFKRFSSVALYWKFRSHGYEDALWKIKVTRWVSTC